MLSVFLIYQQLLTALQIRQVSISDYNEKEYDIATLHSVAILIKMLAMEDIGNPTLLLKCSLPKFYLYNVISNNQIN